jgi:hypothetical protein
MAQAENTAPSGGSGNSEGKEEEKKEEWRQEMGLWGACAEAVHACKAEAVNLFLAASHPNLVWEKS